LTWFFRGPLTWWARLNVFDGQVSDKVSHKVAKLIQQDNEQRDRLTSGIYLGDDPKGGARRIDDAFKMVKKAENVEKKIKAAVRAKTLPKKRLRFLVDEALEKNVITKEEFEVLSMAVTMRLDAVQVDDFSQEEYLARNGAVGAKP